MEEHSEVLIQQAAKEAAIEMTSAQKIIDLLDEGNTVPFIARYRKEMTNSADEVQIQAVLNAWNYAKQLQTRKVEVLRLIEEQGKLTEELQTSIEQADKLQAVEDLYRPYKKKRATRATKAKDKGLEPLAKWVWDMPDEGNFSSEAKKYFNEEHDLQNEEQVAAGVNDILAEWIADDPEVRKALRERTYQDGVVRTEAKDAEADEKGIYEVYYEYQEAVKKIPSYRVLAVTRGEKEGILRLGVEVDREKMESLIQKHLYKGQTPKVAGDVFSAALTDSYKRLLAPAIERDIRGELWEKAEDHAISVFAENLRHLLLQPPMKGKVVLGVDPAYRTGCKLSVIDATGKVLEVATIYPTPPYKQIEKSKKLVTRLINTYGVEVIAVGNGTASRETEAFIAELVGELDKDIAYLIVNEAGASVYSASEVGRREFPDLQTEERSAASIARRFQDPLAELVKIDPKSIGVGQYQHDVAASKLNHSLQFVVETAVNQVGVNLNTASASLLQYVSGLSKAVAENIVAKREEEGEFTSRKQLKKVPRLGNKTFEQAVGFLRLPEGADPLDATAIHPESYPAAKQLLQMIEATMQDIGTAAIHEKLEDIDVTDAAHELGIGRPTLEDMIADLKRPHRDVREQFSQPLLKTGVMEISDLKVGMELQGTVRNVVDFGAFVDIGVKEDGLVHISKLSNRFVKNPMDVVAVGDVVTVWVDTIDEGKGRIGLTMV
ncbi:uncharacterized protein B0H94_11572 [Salsuginibacillus halophilus]|uniref:S1 motif domain-containing protein n=1 Tax=Salsuginibacillus halophilus TaxID=517424 RepID=A0A2P8H8B8_9BACI|nr:Tex family protein [Salsuginibacillus halophilus]PSL42468.1 uncharacterized protein B0H94_11572 [Salsuginibacillus halophilus]